MDEMDKEIVKRVKKILKESKIHNVESFVTAKNPNEKTMALIYALLVKTLSQTLVFGEDKETLCMYNLCKQAFSNCYSEAAERAIFTLKALSNDKQSDKDREFMQYERKIAGLENLIEYIGSEIADLKSVNLA